MHTLCTLAHLCTPAHPHTLVHLCRGDGAAGEAAAAVAALQTQLVGQAEQTVATLRESLAGLGVSVDGIGGSRVSLVLTWNGNGNGLLGRSFYLCIPAAATANGSEGYGDGGKQRGDQ